MNPETSPLHVLKARLAVDTQAQATSSFTRHQLKILSRPDQFFVLEVIGR